MPENPLFMVLGVVAIEVLSDSEETGRTKQKKCLLKREKAKLEDSPPNLIWFTTIEEERGNS